MVRDQDRGNKYKDSKNAGSSFDVASNASEESAINADDFNYMEKGRVTDSPPCGPARTEHRYEGEFLDTPAMRNAATREANKRIKKAKKEKRKQQKEQSLPIKKGTARKVSAGQKKLMFDDSSESEKERRPQRVRTRQKPGGTRRTEDANQSVSEGKENRSPRGKDEDRAGANERGTRDKTKKSPKRSIFQPMPLPLAYLR